MSASDRRVGPAAADASPPAASPRGVEGGWLDRMQRARSRQAAIARNLYTWSNYKSWADQVKGSWEPEQEPKK